jgi:hypothetical protein
MDSDILTTNRSIAIDHLQKRFAESVESVGMVLYIYFDYKSQRTQTMVGVIRCLLKQLISRFSELPADIISLYDEYIKKDEKPDIAKLMEFLYTWTMVFPTYIIFDALDECSDETQSETLSFFAHLQKSNCRILISSRPHLQCLKDGIRDKAWFEVKAHEADLASYVLVRLKEELNRDRLLKERCLELIKNTEGMYVTYDFVLIQGFCLLNSKWTIYSNIQQENHELRLLKQYQKTFHRHILMSCRELKTVD